MPETPDGGWLLDDTPFLYGPDGEPEETEEEKKEREAAERRKRNG